MADKQHQLEHYTHAIQGLGATACAAALRCAASDPKSGMALDHLRRLAILASTSERAQTCLAVIAKADADAEVAMFESAGLQTLSLMNRIADIATPTAAGPSDARRTPTANVSSH